jgi:hypothetical protein
MNGLTELPDTGSETDDEYLMVIFSDRMHGLTNDQIQGLPHHHLLPLARQTVQQQAVATTEWPEFHRDQLVVILLQRQVQPLRPPAQTKKETQTLPFLQQTSLFWALNRQPFLLQPEKVWEPHHDGHLLSIHAEQLVRWRVGGTNAQPVLARILQCYLPRQPKTHGQCRTRLLLDRHTLVVHIISAHRERYFLLVGDTGLDPMTSTM